MDRTVRVMVIVVMLVVSLGWTGPVLAVGGTSPAGIEPTEHAIVDGPGPAQQDPSSFDFVEFHITVDEDASARWTVRYTRVLRNESEVTAFEAFADDFNENETPFFENFRQQAEGLAAAGRNETGRDMTADGYERDAHIESGGLTNDLGVVSVSFRWGDFAAIRDGRLHVGDVFTGGLYIGPEQRLTITAGDGLRFADADGDGLAVDPAPDSVDAGGDGANGSVSWSGDRLFGDGRPRAVLVPVDEDGDGAGDGGTGDGASDGGAGDGTDGGGDDPGGDGSDEGTTLSLWSMLAGGLVLVVVLGAVGWWWRRGDSPAGVEDGTQSGGATAVSEGRSPRPIPDEELLSDEDRVVRMLEHNGGRMKQVDIVNETDWSKSKVSMLLSDMEEEGTVSKLRVGRENIVSLAGHEPEATRSALERGDE